MKDHKITNNQRWDPISIQNEGPKSILCLILAQFC